MAKVYIYQELMKPPLSAVAELALETRWKPGNGCHLNELSGHMTVLSHFYISISLNCIRNLTPDSI